MKKILHVLRGCLIAVVITCFSSGLLASNEQIVALESQIAALDASIQTNFPAYLPDIQQYLYLKDLADSNRLLSRQAGISKPQKKDYIRKARQFEHWARILRKNKKLPVAAIAIAVDIKNKTALLKEFTHIPLSAMQASRFLQQATFGSTEAEINALTGNSAWEWIQEQFVLPRSSHMAKMKHFKGTRKFNAISRLEAWWDISLHGEDQLRQRVAFALSEIFVVSDKVSALGVQPLVLANYYDILAEHSFGNYRQLLEAVTLSPVMGNYLSHLGNEKANPAKNIRPDENYAREILQLFSIGLVELNIDGTPRLDAEGKVIPTYSQEQITGFANVFTGWTYSGRTDFKIWAGDDWLSPMMAFDNYHSMDSKVLLNGVVLPPDQTARQDLTEALDNIFNHPNVGPFISKQLIQRLVTSNPTPQYVARVATVFNDNGKGIRGDLKAVVQAILLDQEARELAELKSYSGKIREPLLRSTHLWRALNAYTTDGTFYTWDLDDSHSQAPLSSISVFNFFSPDYSPTPQLQAQKLVAPELQIANDSALIALMNTVWHTTIWSMAELGNGYSAGHILIRITRLTEILDQQGVDALIDYLDLVFLAGNMDEKLRGVLHSVASKSVNMPVETRAGLLLFTVLVSPNYVTQI
jgi:uncharacterized protein (DUF1800 family)